MDPEIEAEIEKELQKEKERETYRDQYDLMEMGSRVHTTHGTLNRDFTLSSTIAPLEDWANKQLICSEMIADIIGQHSDKDQRVKWLAEDLKRSLVSEVVLRMIFTRSRDGKVLNGVIGVGTGGEVQLKEKVGFLKKLFGGSDKKKEKGEEEE